MEHWENDYEDKILSYQESETDECDSCEYKQNCRSQCMEIAATYNSNLKARYLNVARFDMVEPIN